MILMLKIYLQKLLLKLKKKPKKAYKVGEEVENIEEALKDQQRINDTLEQELEQKVRELSRYKKQNTQFNLEIKKLLQENTSLSEESRGFNMKFELESKARQDLQFKYDNEFKKLEEELQINKKNLEEELSQKKSLQREAKKAGKDVNVIMGKLEVEEKKSY